MCNSVIIRRSRHPKLYELNPVSRPQIPKFGQGCDLPRKIDLRSHQKISNRLLIFYIFLALCEFLHHQNNRRQRRHPPRFGKYSGNDPFLFWTKIFYGRCYIESHKIKANCFSSICLANAAFKALICEHRLTFLPKKSSKMRQGQTCASLLTELSISGSDSEWISDKSGLWALSGNSVTSVNSVELPLPRSSCSNVASLKIN